MLVDGRPDQIFAAAGFALAALVALFLVPVSARIAWKIGAIDHPRARSLHVDPTPRLGGLAMLAGALVAGSLFLPAGQQTTSLAIGAVVIATVGALDDVFDLPALLKLAGQVVAAAIPAFNGVNVGAFTLPFVGGVDLRATLFELPLIGDVHSGHLLTIIGIVAVINVINLIDGIDGLAAGVTVISAGSLAIIALSLNRPGAGVLAAITAGAAFGFLRYGFPPASSFMGDSGSNLLGFLLGAIAVQGALKTNAVIALFFPLIILAVPILDTSFVIAKRIKQRRPIHVADRSHFHHRMADIGYSQRGTLLYLYGWAGVMAGLALALRFVPYSDDQGNFDPFWTAVMIAFLLVALGASFYLVVTLEILKLRLFRRRQVAVASGVEPDQAAIDAAIEREFETGEFKVVDQSTGELSRLDQETGEFRAIDPGRD